MNAGARHQTFRIAVRRYGPFERAMEAQWSAFEREARTGLALDLVLLDLQPLEHALFTAGGMAGGEWDVAFVATDWVAAMSRLGCAVDLSPRLAAEPPESWPHGWTPSLRRLQNIQGKILGVPYHDGPECLIVRRDLFEDSARQNRFFQQHGRKLAVPRTWAEFHEVARFFHAPADGFFGAAFAAFPDGHNSVYDFLLQLWTRGGELTKQDGALQFCSPQAEAALTFYRDIVNDPRAVHPACQQLDSVALGACFAAGELAMMVNWFGFAAAAHTSAESAVRGLVDIAALPCEQDGRSVSLNVYWLLALASGSPHQAIGWQFLRHTLTPAMDLLTTTSGAIGCRTSTWNDPQVNATIPFYRRLEQLHQTAREIPQREDWPAIAQTIDKLMARALTTQTSVGELLLDAQRAHS